MRRFTWILLSQNAQVIGVDATSLTVGFKTAGARDSFIGGGSEEILRQAAIDMIGADWKIETAVDPSAQPGQETAPRVTQSGRPAPSRRPPAAEPPVEPSDQAPPDRRAGRRARRTSKPAPARPETIAAARSNIAPDPQRRRAGASATGPDPDADAHRDDPAADDNGLDSTELLAARARRHRHRRDPPRLTVTHDREHHDQERPR